MTKKNVVVIVSDNKSIHFILHASRDFIMCLLEMAMCETKPRNVDCMHWMGE